MRRFWLLLLPGVFAVACWQLKAATFDLTGPKVDVRVKRGSVTLPIASVPNLLGGDRLWIHPDLPESQSEHFVLVAAFLRGVTNPPPADWFTRVETWNPSVRSEGVYVTVPQEAQQAVIFLVPETGGDFNTLKKAVHDQPGSFVRAVQDLQAASWDRMRVETYLAQVKVTSQSDQKNLKERAEMASRSLGIKLEQQCFEKPPEQQSGCLAQNPDGLVLDDSNVQSLVAQLTGGSTGDLVNAISSTNLAGGGAYSAYVGAVVDTAKILSSLHTAHFRYIPALALPTADTLNLRLATPPSFRSPKTVVVVALPPVSEAKEPPLHPVNPAESFCIAKPGLVLPAEGAPMVFAAEMAHDLKLRLEVKGKDGAGAAQSVAQSMELPVVADSSRGGLVRLPAAADAVSTLSGDLTGEVRGKWGFGDWAGPKFHLHAASSTAWTVAAADQSALVVGRDDTLHLEGDNTLCVDRVEATDSNGTAVKIAWKSPRPDTLELAVPLKDAPPGQVSFSVYQFGQQKPQIVAVKAYANAASLDRFTINVGDRSAYLKGTRLDEVASAELNNLGFEPDVLSRVADSDLLTMKTTEATNRLVSGSRATVKVTLRDGRVLKTQALIELPRPQVALASKGVQAPGTAGVEMGSPDDLPLDGRLVFFLKSVAPANFPRDARVELAAVDASFQTMLSLSDGSLILEDAHTAMGSIEPMARFGASAFGPVQVRVVSANGTASDWLQLGTLVRIPGFKELRCPHSAAKPCTLLGTNLFLATSFSAIKDFSASADVPPEFTGTQIQVPHTVGGVLYVKLRDDPAAAAVVTLPVTPVAGENRPAALPPAAESKQEPANPAQSVPPAADPAASNPALNPAGKPQP